MDELQSYRMLLKITNATINERTREGLFREITAVLKPLLRFERISILINNPGKSHWEYFTPALGTTIPGLKNNTMPPERAAVPVRVMTEKRTIITDLDRDSGLPETALLRRARIRSFVCTPLLIRDQVLGSLQFFYRGACPLRADEIELCEKACQQIALAIDNMLAYEALEQMRDQLSQETAFLRREIASSECAEIVYASPAMERIIEIMKAVADADTTVLITGETGTGKDLVARKLHEWSSHRANTFIKVNCAALVPTLIESELFGHEKGAFTGALARKAGRFELSRKSTLFLDEISELPLHLQAKLLQVLQDKAFERVGGSETIKTDARIITATNRNLSSMVRDGTFREDLFYRLNIFPLAVPPLRERREDIPVLGRHFALQYSNRLRRPQPRFSGTAVERLLRYDWPGNVRELQNFMERIILLKTGRTIAAADVESVLQIGADHLPAANTLDEMEKRHIETMLKKTCGVIAGPRGAAGLLGMKRSTLLHRMKKLGVQADQYRKS